MYHSITFGEKNTWHDWHLIPASRPVIAPPQVNTSDVTIPGLNGKVDLTEALTGYPTYANRTGSLQFYVVNDYWDWTIAYWTILRYLHGRRMKMILEDDPGFYYEGRFSVNQWSSGQSHSAITINYDLHPYKREFLSTIDEWQWDPFNFITGIINNCKNIAVTGTKTITITGAQEPVVPTISVAMANESLMSVTHTYDGESRTFDLDEGENRPRRLIIREGVNTLDFSGEGIVSVDYRGGWL